MEVALRVDEGGHLHAAFDRRPDTLSLLQRDVRGLEQMLAGKRPAARRCRAQRQPAS
jgi:hypothetical protein